MKPARGKIPFAWPNMEALLPGGPQSVTINRSDLEVLLWGLATCRELLQLLDTHMAQLQGWVEHVRWGGEPGEWRRPRWITVDNVKDRYQSK